MHKKDCSVVAGSFLVCFCHFLVDVNDFCFREIFENVFGVLLPECDSFGVQVTS